MWTAHSIASGSWELVRVEVDAFFQTPSDWSGLQACHFSLQMIAFHLQVHISRAGLSTNLNHLLSGILIPQIPAIGQDKCLGMSRLSSEDRGWNKCLNYPKIINAPTYQPGYQQTFQMSASSAPHLVSLIKVLICLVFLCSQHCYAGCICGSIFRQPQATWNGESHAARAATEPEWLKFSCRIYKLKLSRPKCNNNSSFWLSIWPIWVASNRSRHDLVAAFQLSGPSICHAKVINDVAERSCKLSASSWSLASILDRGGSLCLSNLLN